MNQQQQLPQITFGSYFTGGGVLESGIKDITQSLFGVEYDPAIAEVYFQNYGQRPIVSRVQDVNLDKLPTVDWFHGSPECKEFSNANNERAETSEQISQLTACLDYLKYHRPAFATFENVRGWIHSQSFQLLLKTLTKLGYRYKYTVLNAADYGVPQTRHRLIVIASLKGNPQIPIATHHNAPTVINWFGETKYKWVSWYEAIEDLIPTLPESQFADWQLKRLPVGIKTTLVMANIDCTTIDILQPAATIVSSIGTHTAIPKAYLIPGDNTSNDTVKVDDEPMVTVRARSTGQCPARAFILDGQPVPDKDGGHDAITVRQEDEPMHTIAAICYKRPSRAYANGRVVKMTPRALARFMGMPDWYKLPEKDSLACKIIGNGVPAPLGRAIAKEIYRMSTGQVFEAVA